MRVPSKKNYMEFCEEYINKMVPYYMRMEDQKGIIREMAWLKDFYQLIRMGIYAAYTGDHGIFAGGNCWIDVIVFLRDCGVNVPDQITKDEARETEKRNRHLENICGKYLPDDFYQVMQELGINIPLERRTYYMLFIPKWAFTEDDQQYMQHNPGWQLILSSQPSYKGRNMRDFIEKNSKRG